MRIIDADNLFRDKVFLVSNSDSLEAIKKIMNIIDEAPTIEAEPVRHGKWIFEPKDALEMMFTKPKCSECGYESADGLYYCPNCGAKMDEED